MNPKLFRLNKLCSVCVVCSDDAAGEAEGEQTTGGRVHLQRLLLHDGRSRQQPQVSHGSACSGLEINLFIYLTDPVGGFHPSLVFEAFLNIIPLAATFAAPKDRSLTGLSPLWQNGAALQPPG